MINLDILRKALEITSVLVYSFRSHDSSSDSSDEIPNELTRFRQIALEAFVLTFTLSNIQTIKEIFLCESATLALMLFQPPCY